MSAHPETLQGMPSWPDILPPLFSCSRFVLVGFKTNSSFSIDLKNPKSLEFSEDLYDLGEY
jgi:hypothetical protein